MTMARLASQKARLGLLSIYLPTIQAAAAQPNEIELTDADVARSESLKVSHALELAKNGQFWMLLLRWRGWRARRPDWDCCRYIYRRSRPLPPSLTSPTYIDSNPNLAFWLASLAIVIAAVCFMLTKIELTDGSSPARGHGRPSAIRFAPHQRRLIQFWSA
jgi:hypothetical protein